MPQGEISTSPVSSSGGGGIAPAFRPSYDALVLSDTPVLYLGMGSTTSTDPDLTANGHTATYQGGQPARVYLPNGELVADFSGAGQYLEVADADDLSVPTSGILTVEAWMRPDVLSFSPFESTGYIHWMGKGVGGHHEWACRMYNLSTTDVPERPNRISGYCFNVAGGTGVGAYFQDGIIAGQWIHYAITINTVNTSVSFPTGYVSIFRTGVQRNQQSLATLGITPTNSTAPMRIGTRDLASYFQGAVGKVAVYNYELTPAQLAAHYTRMTTT